MERIIAGLLGLMIVSAPGVAAAADAYSKPAGLKDDGQTASANKTDFSGAYVGVGGGGAFYNTELGGFFDGIGSDGVVGEAVLGYDIRRGDFVFGPRIIGGLSNVNTEIGGQDLVNLDGYLNIGGRAGLVINRTLLYVHGGYEMMWLSSDSPSFNAALEDADTNALTVGLGAESVISDHWTFAIEGSYVHGLDDANDFAKVEGGRGVVRLNFRQ